jgi:hypothetical protein
VEFLRHDFSGIAGTGESMEAASAKTGLLAALPVRGGWMKMFRFLLALVWVGAYLRRWWYPSNYFSKEYRHGKRN